MARLIRDCHDHRASVKGCKMEENQIATLGANHEIDNIIAGLVRRIAQLGAENAVLRARLQATEAAQQKQGCSSEAGA